MADEILTFDAAGSMPDGTDPGAPTNSPLSIGPGTSYPLLEASFPAPPVNVMYSSSVDTEGELAVSRRYGNRTITLRIAMDESGANNTLLDALQMKFAKLQREGGTLKRTRKDGSTIRIYDIVTGDGWGILYDHAYLLAHSAEVAVTFPASPLARGAEVELGTDTVETTLPCLIKTVTGPAGDAPALGRLLIDNDDATNDQRWLTWGLQSRNYSNATTAALFYEAEALTPQGGAAIATRTGASGGGTNNVISTGGLELPQQFKSILSLKLLAGTYFTHVGQYNVYARVLASTTATRLALQWGQGDFLVQGTNAEVGPVIASEFCLVDLGQVDIERAVTGTNRWEGRILARAVGVNGAAMEIDCVFLVPVTEGFGQVSAVARFAAPSAQNAQDSFFATTTGGALSARVAPLGGTWVTSGAATDLTFTDGPGSGEESVTRNATGARYGILGATNYTNVEVGALVQTSNPVNTATQRYGVVTRWVDSSNYVFAGVTTGVTRDSFSLITRVAGTETVQRTVSSPISTMNRWWDVRLAAYTTGRMVALLYIDQVLIARLVANSTAVATAGALASGKPGILDDPSSATFPTRYYANFYAASPTVEDAAVFASQSVQVTHNNVVREDTTGTVWSAPGSYEGDYVLVPSAGAEGRSSRLIVMGSRNVLGEGPDSGVDDLSARLFATPRYLS